MKRTTKVAAVAALVGAGVLTATAAYATSTYQAWNVNLPSLQQGVMAGDQTKTSQSAAGDIHVSGVAAGYQVNAHQCRVDHAAPQLILSCGTERFGLGGGADATLPSGNYVAAGSTAFLELHNTSWVLIRVNAHGVWRAN